MVRSVREGLPIRQNLRGLVEEAQKEARNASQALQARLVL